MAETVAEPRESFAAGPVQQVASPHQPVAQEPGLGDGLAALMTPHSTEKLLKASLRKPEQSAAELGYVVVGQADNDLDAHTVRHRPGLALLATVMLASGFLGACANFSPAHAQAARNVTQSSAVGSEAELSRLARSYGLNPAVLENAIARGQVGNVLKVLPEEMRSMYRELSSDHKQIIMEKLNGTSGFLFIQVSNKEAFIKGEAMGYNTFDEMQTMLKDKAREMRLDKKLQDKLARSIEAFRDMSPQQRSALVSLMEADVAAMQR